MKNNSDRIIIEFIKDKEIFKSIKNSIGERLKVRETVYYRVRNQDGNTNSPSPK
jgi:ribosomal protein L17